MTDGAPALPVIHMDTASHTASNEAATILIAEDNEPLRQLLCLFLEGEGFQVLQGRNGKEALTIAKEYIGRIDVLISDVLMPELDGAGLAVKMWEVRPATAAHCYVEFQPGDIDAGGKVAIYPQAIFSGPVNPDDSRGVGTAGSGRRR